MANVHCSVFSAHQKFGKTCVPLVCGFIVFFVDCYPERKHDGSKREKVEKYSESSYPYYFTSISFCECYNSAAAVS